MKYDTKWHVSRLNMKTSVTLGGLGTSKYYANNLNLFMYYHVVIRKLFRGVVLEILEKYFLHIAVGHPSGGG